MQQTKIVFIKTTGQLNQLVRDLIKNSHRIALDFECEFNLHRYGMHLCLIQLFDGKICYLIDTVEIENLRILKKLFTSRLQKVMFAARGDLCLIHHLYKFQMRNIFDIQIAAKMLDFPSLSLAGVMKDVLDVTTSKSKSKQRANWNLRPLSKKLIRYAADDVLYLLQLQEKFQGWLNTGSRKTRVEFARENRQLEHARFNPVTDPHLKIKKAKSLDLNQQKYLKAFYEVREEIARQLDMSPHTLLRNDILIKISRHLPRTREQWLALEGMHKKAASFIDRFIQAKMKLD